MSRCGALNCRLRVGPGPDMTTVHDNARITGRTGIGQTMADIDATPVMRIRTRNGRRKETSATLSPEPGGFVACHCHSLKPTIVHVSSRGIAGLSRSVSGI